MIHHSNQRISCDRAPARRLLLVLLCFLAAITLSCEAFCPTTARATRHPFAATAPTVWNTNLFALPPTAGSFVAESSTACASSSISSLTPSMDSSSMELSAATVDPTSILSDLAAGLLGTPAILLVPILAALTVAGLIAFFIVSYANPEVEDDE